MGPIALHGGGEYVAGDERAMDALLAEAIEAARARSHGGAPASRAGDSVPRIVVVPTAAAHQRPELAAAHGERAFRAAADRAGVAVRVETAMIVDASTAADPRLAARLADADLVHLPGGAPDVVPTVLAGSPAWAGILAAHERGAVVAGASAGAMALCDWLWTPGGGVRGLGLISGLAVLPHFTPGRLASWVRAIAAAGAPPLAWVGLDERTLVIGRPGRGPWRAEGAGRAHLVPAGRRAATQSAAAGQFLPVPGIASA